MVSRSPTPAVAAAFVVLVTANQLLPSFVLPRLNLNLKTRITLITIETVCKRTIIPGRSFQASAWSSFLFRLLLPLPLLGTNEVPGSSLGMKTDGARGAGLGRFTVRIACSVWLP